MNFKNTKICYIVIDFETKIHFFKIIKNLKKAIKEGYKIKVDF